MLHSKFLHARHYKKIRTALAKEELIKSTNLSFALPIINEYLDTFETYYSKQKNYSTLFSAHGAKKLHDLIYQNQNKPDGLVKALAAIPEATLLSLFKYWLNCVGVEFLNNQGEVIYDSVSAYRKDLLSSISDDALLEIGQLIYNTKLKNLMYVELLAYFVPVTWMVDQIFPDWHIPVKATGLDIINHENDIIYEDGNDFEVNITLTLKYELLRHFIKISQGQIDKNHWTGPSLLLKTNMMCEHLPPALVPLSRNLLRTGSMEALSNLYLGGQAGKQNHQLNFYGINFNRWQLCNLNFNHADCRYSQWVIDCDDKTYFAANQFNHADLSHSRMLTGMRSSNFQAANLSYAHLSGDFSGCDFRGALLEQCDLSGAFLFDCIGLSEKVLDEYLSHIFSDCEYSANRLDHLSTGKMHLFHDKSDLYKLTPLAGIAFDSTRGELGADSNLKQLGKLWHYKQESFSLDAKLLIIASLPVLSATFAFNDSFLLELIKSTKLNLDKYFPRLIVAAKELLSLIEADLIADKSQMCSIRMS